MDIITMYPLDFEEFAAVNGVGDAVITSLRKSFEQKKPVDQYIHERMMSLFELYLIVGGMPAAVSTYLNTKNLRRVAEEQNAIIHYTNATYRNMTSRISLNSTRYLI